MIEKVELAIETYKLIEPGDKIVVAVSGGPDSMALLHSLHTLSKTYFLKLYVCHLNHMLRGEDADEDARTVKAFCDDLHIESYIFSRDIEAYAKVNQMGFEEAARDVRYKLFDYVLEKTGANKIAVGQNMNDQAETLLMRLYRGAGLEGLTAIKYKRDHVIRPLLGINRDEIEAYVLQHNIKTCLDKTNLETDYSRNKIRLEVIPYIKENFNENIIKRLYETTMQLQEDADFIDQTVENTYRDFVHNQDQVNLNLWCTLHIAVQKRLLRKVVLKQSGSLKDFSGIQLNQLIELIQKKSHGTKLLVKGIYFEISYDNLLIYKEDTKGLIETPFKPGETFIYKNQCLKVINLEDLKATKHVITIDVEKIVGELKIRTRLPGDRFAPLGMKGTKKLKDFMIDEKIPAKDRDDVLLLCDDEHIIWVVGYRMSELYKIDASTLESLTIKWQKCE
ncbi:MAG: tRNA lysidine(34) synthetase TilS [Clostridia bacterium]|nr:tRNA lysidine(34) synthetase TilS [Clostridia bacterium]